MKANQRIRKAAATAGVRIWQIADAYGVSEGHFIRKLRYELPESEQAKILSIIDRLSKEEKQ